jgi:hypothetical protein
LRVKPARSDNHAGPIDQTKDNTPGDCPAPGRVRKRGRAAPQVSDYSVSSELPENVPISENELRALEILLGPELKELLAKSGGKPLK